MLQPRISAILKPGKTRLNIETLRRFAEAFDCGLIVKFAPFSELARWSEFFDPESFYVPSFSEDDGFIETKPAARETHVASEFAGRHHDIARVGNIEAWPKKVSNKFGSSRKR